MIFTHKSNKKKIKIRNEFSFSLVSIETIKRIINDLDIKKTLPGDIPVSIFEKCDFVFNTVTVCVNKALASRIFSGDLKCTNISPKYTKKMVRKTID